MNFLPSFLPFGDTTQHLQDFVTWECVSLGSVSYLIYSALKYSFCCSLQICPHFVKLCPSENMSDNICMRVVLKKRWIFSFPIAFPDKTQQAWQSMQLPDVSAVLWEQCRMGRWGADWGRGPGGEKTAPCWNGLTPRLQSRSGSVLELGRQWSGP